MSPILRLIGLGILLGLSACLMNSGPRWDGGDWNWGHYNGSPNSNKYAPLDQVNKENVHQLEVAWTYTFRPGERFSDVKCNLLAVDGVVYGVTGSKNLVAVDAATGEEIWYTDFRRIDSLGRQPSARGVLYWEKEEDRRIFYVYGNYLYAVQAEDGSLVSSFGQNGRVPYSTGVTDDPRRWVRLTTPGRIYRDLIITGSFVNERYPSAPGHIRAFNALTGELEWTFHTVPRPGEYGYETWPKDAWTYIGGTNNWAGMSLDEERGIVYVPTGSPTYDFYGANRIGQNLFANTLLALDAETGRRIWHYQIVHHDLWDRDLPCPPNLLTVEQNGKRIDAVAQPTKHGFLFLFDRETGEPLFEINEIPVPRSTMPGEQSWPTQPIPVKPPPFTRQELTPDQITDLSPEDHDYVAREIKKYKTALFTPPDTTGVVMIPEFASGVTWGGAAVYEPTGHLFVNANDVPGFMQLTNQEREMKELTAAGKSLYRLHCAGCHGASRKGGSYIPSLVGLAKNYDRREVYRIIAGGKGQMQGMDFIPDEQKEAIAAYLLREEYEYRPASPDKGGLPKSSETFLKYRQDGYPPFEDLRGYPAAKPPWATLSSYDMNTGELNWRIPLGEDEGLTEKGIPPTGVDQRGGPVVTAGGLLFIAATNDGKIRAFDKDNGELLWERDLGGDAPATPSVYQLNGVQYLVVPVTGNEESAAQGKYVAFALPR